MRCAAQDHAVMHGVMKLGAYLCCVCTHLEDCCVWFSHRTKRGHAEQLCHSRLSLSTCVHCLCHLLTGLSALPALLVGPAIGGMKCQAQPLCCCTNSGVCCCVRVLYSWAWCDCSAADSVKPEMFAIRQTAGHQQFACSCSQIVVSCNAWVGWLLVYSCLHT